LLIFRKSLDFSKLGMPYAYRSKIHGVLINSLNPNFKMQMNIHRASERGTANIGWLQTSYSFSFSNYHNPKRMGFGALRVLNDDTFAAGAGFPAHSHSDMEIVTIVLEGALEHKDSSGGHGVIKAGEVQYMCAGSGVTHSEFNHSKTEPVKLFQVWVVPSKQNLPPKYEQKSFEGADMKNKFSMIVSGKKEKGAFHTNQDAVFSIGEFDKGKSISYSATFKGNGIFVFPVSGSVEIGDEKINARDSAEITGSNEIEIKALEKSKVLVIEVPVK